MVAAAAGLALLVLMFLPWFGGRVVGLSAPIRVNADTGWQACNALFDFLIVAAVAIAVGTVVARMANARVRLPLEQGLLVLIAGVVASVVVGVQLLDPPDGPDVAAEIERSREAAPFLALVAAAAIAYGGLLQRRE